jgi:hypothetical protein
LLRRIQKLLASLVRCRFERLTHCI